MTSRDRENATLSFRKPEDRGAVEETFFPWNLTVERWKNEGLSQEIIDRMNDFSRKEIGKDATYLNNLIADSCHEFENYLGFDGIKRLFFGVPFNNFDAYVIEETEEYVLKQEADGWQRKYYKTRDLHEEFKPPVTHEEDWAKVKKHALKEIETYYTDENIVKVFSPYKEGHQRGDFPIRIAISGFFWTPRTLMGIAEHMMAFYDYPDMLHDMNEFILQVYIDKLSKVLDILPADVLYIMEDLSGTNGPMLSPSLFDEFVGAYYKKLVAMAKSKGVKNILVDTDGDFNILIPNFIEAGIDGFLPMDVNAGMDIVEVRRKFPGLKFIGAFNKLEIAKGKEAIDKEFERLLPVIRQGGYIPGCDHQVAPSTSYANYQYYIKRLKEVMKQAGADIG